jgi:hypothetical protein
MPQEDSDVSKLWTVIGLVVAVFAVSALFGWTMFRFAKSMERTHRDPKYRRRQLLYGAAIYGIGIVVGVSEVLSGDAPPAILLAIPIPLLLVWWFLRLAKQVKNPPD